MKNITSPTDNTFKPNLEEIYRKEFAHISSDTYKSILDNREIAIEYAQIGLTKTGNANPTKRQIEEHADIMQSVAKLILKERENEGK